MKFTFLGTGTSSGVPVLGCQCEVCRSRDPRDRRFRCVGLLETASTRLLISPTSVITGVTHGSLWMLFLFHLF